MNFFANITALQILGLVLLVAGALLTFLSGKIAAKMKNKRADMICKCCGVGAVFAGFLLIMFA